MTCVPEGSSTIGVPLITVVWPFANVDVLPPTVIDDPGANVCVPITITVPEGAGLCGLFGGLFDGGGWFGFDGLEFCGAFGGMTVGTRVTTDPGLPGLVPGASVMTGGGVLAGGGEPFPVGLAGGGVMTTVVDDPGGGGGGGALPSLGAGLPGEFGCEAGGAGGP